MDKQEFNALALNPLDGRYAKVGEKLGLYFSEYALVKRRIYVETKWLSYIMDNQDIKLDGFSEEERKNISDNSKHIFNDFGMYHFFRIKEIENTTKHDVKAVECFIGEYLETLGCGKAKSLVHIGCTSEDINNISYALMLKEGLNDVWLLKALELNSQVASMAQQYKEIPMLAHTHGQPATPTTVGKEFRVYTYRLRESLNNILNIKFKAKFNGATGNYSAISIAFSDLDWEVLAKDFVENYLALEFNPLTTQIESHDYMCHLLDGIRHYNNVVLDMDLDMWLYISMDYFKQIPVKGEVGSSTMPHKVNPIRFENSESNIDMSNSICVSLSNKLPKSRLQRDLSDSSSQRNLGIAIGYSLQAISETIEGLKKCSVNELKIQSDLNEKWEVLAEPIQTMLRKYGIPDAYDTLKELTRGKSVLKEDIISFVKTLNCISETDKNILLEMTPSNYVGYAKRLARKENNE